MHLYLKQMMTMELSFTTNKWLYTACLLCALLCMCATISSQTSVKGTVLDAKDGLPLIGASILVKGTGDGTVSDFDGSFELSTTAPMPFSLVVSYTGYGEKVIEITDASKAVKIRLEEAVTLIDVVEVRGQRISDKQKQSALTVESMDLIAIKETPSVNFYQGLGSLKDVDLTTASLGFTIINTRGFNSTSPVRSLQIIDGLDNQSPGLNFSLGNFLGASELDVNKVELIVGASTAFYGPNAFNGVISMQTKNPFLHQGLAAKVKVGERNLINTEIRWANSVLNKQGYPSFAYKLNFSYLSANDWEATNDEPVWESEVGVDNPGGYDAVNTYGDEYQAQNDFRDAIAFPGLGVFYRSGYKEVDLVDYDSKNTKAAAAFHFRLNPARDVESPELILSSSFGGGTTVYQGENRFSLRDIQFFQHRLEIRKNDHYFFRVYATHEDAGKSYDPFFTALQLQSRQKDDGDWSKDYSSYWQFQIANISQPQLGRLTRLEGFPDILDFLGDPDGFQAAMNAFLTGVQDSVVLFHQEARAAADGPNPVEGTRAFLKPGTPEFQTAFDDITSRISNLEGGTKFFDRSALIHANGEYQFNDLIKNDQSSVADLDIIVGAAGRLYIPDSKGSILLDTLEQSKVDLTGDTSYANINTYEYGVYAGGTLGLADNRLKINVSARFDNHENFNGLFSPAASIVYTPSKNNYLRVSFNSAIRNPTLTDQYLNYNVGRAILRGNITGFEDLITVESFVDFLNTGNRDTLIFFDIPAIQPEEVKTIEVGYRTTLFKSLYLDLGYYFSSYDNFIGYELGIEATIPPQLSIPTAVQAFRISSNAKDRVTTQGFSIGANFYFWDYFMLKANYSWNKLNTQTDDPIIPAYNTPENKYNIGLSGRDLTVNLGGWQIPNFGFNVNYKWIEGFLFEGSPQFTGFIPTYTLVDAQINWRSSKLNTTFKLGASNILNDKNFQTYGGPRIGRMGYFSILYDWKKKN